MRIEEVETENEYLEYEEKLSGNFNAVDLSDSWDMFVCNCRDRGIDSRQYMLRAVAFSASRDYNRPVEVVLADLKKWPVTDYSNDRYTGRSGCCGGEFCEM